MRRRLLAAIAGVAAAAVALFAVPLALVLQRTIVDEELLRLQRDTVAATRQIDLGRRGDPVELPPTASALAVYDLRGVRVAGRGPARGDRLVRDALRSRRPSDGRESGQLLAAVPLLTDERVSGVVRAARDDGEAAADVHRGWLLVAAVAAALVALAALAARLLAARLAVPLERLAAAAGRLGDGDFSVRAPRAEIGEVDAVARALDATAARLHELVQRERAFTADASHQLRTPLAALRLEIESLQLRRDAPELAAALRQVDRLQSTIDTLLGLARDAPRSQRRTSVQSVLDEVEARWRGLLAGESRPLRVQAPPATVQVDAAAAVVVEVLDVLLDNARRHGAGAVVISARIMGGFAAIEVRDGGPGFRVDVEQAFRRRSPTAEGHGIGLALARSLAEAEGGRLEVPHAGPEPVVRLVLQLAADRIDDRFPAATP